MNVSVGWGSTYVAAACPVIDWLLLQDLCYGAVLVLAGVWWCSLCWLKQHSIAEQGPFSNSRTKQVMCRVERLSTMPVFVLVGRQKCFSSLHAACSTAQQLCSFYCSVSPVVLDKDGCGVDCIGLLTPQAWAFDFLVSWSCWCRLHKPKAFGGCVEQPGSQAAASSLQR